MRGVVDDVRREATGAAVDAHRLRELAVALGLQRDVDWSSSDAIRWRDDLTVLMADLRREADELDQAAGALRRHADEADETLDQIAAAERWFSGRLSDARRLLSSAVDEVSDAAVSSARRVVNAARSMPSTGSLSWLSFRG